jgi:hypothetical protein
MSDHPAQDENRGGWPTDERQTDEYPTIAQTLTMPLDEPVWRGEDEANPLDEEWVSLTRSGIRLGMPVAALLAIVLLAGGFWAGAALEKSHGTGGSSSLASLAARIGGGAGAGATGATGLRGFPGVGGGSTAATAGTISVVDGDTLDVKTSDGIVKVTITRSTTITRNADAAADGLRPGDTVVVQGASGASGTVSASSISATAPGVSSGFPAFGGGTGAAPGAGTGNAATKTTTTNTTTTPSLFGG